MPCIVVDVKGIKLRLYRLQCQFGILNGRISESSLEAYYGKLDVSTTDWKKEPQLSLHEATIKYNPEMPFMLTHVIARQDARASGAHVNWRAGFVPRDAIIPNHAPMDMLRKKKSL